MATVNDLTILIGILDYIIMLRAEIMKRDQVIEELQKQLGEKKDG